MIIKFLIIDDTYPVFNIKTYSPITPVPQFIKYSFKSFRGPDGLSIKQNIRKLQSSVSCPGKGHVMVWYYISHLITKSSQIYL